MRFLILLLLPLSAFAGNELGNGRSLPPLGTGAEVTSFAETPKKLSLEASTAINSGMVNNYRWYKHPGAQVMLAYAASPRDSVSLAAMRQSQSESSSLTTVSAGYKRWLNDSALRPFLVASAGFARSQYLPGADEESLLVSLGAGARYAIAKLWGIGASANLQRIGIFGDQGSRPAVQFNFGIDVLL